MTGTKNKINSAHSDPRDGVDAMGHAAQSTSALLLEADIEATRSNFCFGPNPEIKLGRLQTRVPTRQRPILPSRYPE
jgi:hypothetical protein